VPAQRYRKKPVEIEACQLTEANLDAVAAWAGGHNVASLEWDYGVGAYWKRSRLGWYFAPARTPGVVIPTLEGDHFAAVGDWVIKGVAGEFYPCKPDIFAATYEKVDG
jgi:hypothetical protein